MTLEQILTEEDKASILNEVERERRRVLVMRMYEEGMSSGDQYVREGTAQSLAALAPVDSIKYVELYEKGINDVDELVRKNTAGTLAALASIDQYKFIELWEKYLSIEELDKVKYRGGYTEIIAETLAALVPINPYKFVELWEKWRHEKEHDEIREIVIGTLATLAPIKPNQFIELAEKVINHIFDNYEEETVAKILVALAPINPNKFVELYEEGIKLKDEYSYETRYEVARTLAALATINPSKFVELCEKGINSEDFHIRRGTTHTLTALAFINQKKFVELLEKGINDEYEDVRNETAKTLGALALVNPDKFVELYENGMSNEDREIRVSISESSALLVAINPDRFIELYKKERNDVCGRVKMNLAHALSVLAKIREEEFIKLYEEGIAGDDEEGIAGDDEESKRFIVKSLEGLVDTNPQKFVELYEKAVVHPNKEVRMGAADIISRLADIDPDRFTRLCINGLIDNEEFIRFSSAKSLGKLAIVNPYKYVQVYMEAISCVRSPEFLPILESLSELASTITQETLVPIKDDGYNFLIAYLSSKYIQNPDGTSRTKEDIQQELINLVRNSEGLNYQRLQRVLDAGQAKDLGKMIECSKVNVKNYRVIKKVGEGAFKTVYLAESELSKGKLVVLKRISPSQFGMDMIKEHYGTAPFSDWLRSEMYITELAKLKPHYVAIPETPVEGEDGHYYLVEEPFKETLKDKLKREGKLKLRDALRITMQIASALEACHKYRKRPVIHKDLKPSNIGLDEKGNVKLTDFGSLESMSTVEGDISNILYSAPEVLRGGKTTMKSNIYSVGILLYEMLTGEHLFAPRNEDGTLKQKPKKEGEERERYRKEILGDIKRVSKMPHGIGVVDERQSYINELIRISRSIRADYKYIPINRGITTYEELEICGYIELADLIATCISYKVKNRSYDSHYNRITMGNIVTIIANNITELEDNLQEEGDLGEKELLELAYKELFDEDKKEFKRIKKLAGEKTLISIVYDRKRKNAKVCLQKYRRLIDDSDYRTIEEALRMKKYDT